MRLYLCTSGGEKQSAIAEAIAATGFQGYVAHEFMPTREPLASLKEAYQVCLV